MSERHAKERPARSIAVGLAFGFVLVSVAARIGLWTSLSALGDRSVARNVATGLLTLLAVLGLTALLQRRLSRWTTPDLALSPSVRGRSARLGLVGLIAGASLFMAVFGATHAVGGIRVRWQPSIETSLFESLATALLVTTLNAAWEEYTFRGWPFSACVRALGPHWTAAGIGVLFGAAHLANPSSRALAPIASVTLAGLLLGYSMLAARNIAMPVGLHVGWNYAQSALTSPRYWEITKHPDPLLSGGAWGLEGSAAGIAVTSAAAFVALAAFEAKGRRDGAKPGEARDPC